MIDGSAISSEARSQSYCSTKLHFYRPVAYLEIVAEG